jgi:hypothetical protein
VFVGDPDGEPTAAPETPGAAPRRMRLVRDGLASDAVPSSDTGADLRAPARTPDPSAAEASPAPAPPPAPRGQIVHGDPPVPPRSFTFQAPRQKAVHDHAQALRASPDDPSRPCWPADLVRRSPASTVLEAGERPAVIVFYDDTARASRLAAADLLPVVAELESRLDLVLVDLTPGRSLSEEERKLVRRYYLGYVPTTVVLSAGRPRVEGAPGAPAPQDRRIRLLKSERVDPAVVRAAVEAPEPANR